MESVGRRRPARKKWGRGLLPCRRMPSVAGGRDADAVGGDEAIEKSMVAGETQPQPSPRYVARRIDRRRLVSTGTFVIPRKKDFVPANFK